jgi:hypothetical protein
VVWWWWGEFREGQGKGEELPGGTGWRREVVWRGERDSAAVASMAQLPADRKMGVRFQAQF